MKSIHIIQNDVIPHDVWNLFLFFKTRKHRQTSLPRLTRNCIKK